MSELERIRREIRDKRIAAILFFIGAFLSAFGVCLNLVVEWNLLASTVLFILLIGSASLFGKAERRIRALRAKEASVL